MASIIAAPDLHNTSTQLGENGHCEYKWSTNISERIVQLSFQLTRTTPTQILKLHQMTLDILNELTREFNNGNISKHLYIQHLTTMFKMVAHTRDPIEGKGEYALAYMLINVWHEFKPDCALFAIKQFLLPPENSPTTIPLGCWKDVKNLYKHSNNLSIRLAGMKYLIQQLKIDSTASTPSLAAKWTPRETSSFGNMYEQLSLMYYPEYINDAKDYETKGKAIKKAKMNFRKLIAGINKKLGTVQINQCEGNWAEIIPNNQTAITMHKQKKAFLNINNKMNGAHNREDREDREDHEDRELCAQNFRDYAQKAANGDVVVKGKRVGLNNFTIDARKLEFGGSIHEKQLLDAQWKDNSSIDKSLHNMIAMVDVSGSMYGDPMDAAIALGIRIAEHSNLGKRVMTFTANRPSWINLDDCDGFCSMVSKLHKSAFGLNTNFAAALSIILKAIVAKKIPASEVKDMVLVILSDMQMDIADHSNRDALMEIITQKYAKEGMTAVGEPYTPPHILFWNLRSTDGFPSLSTQQNTSMMSGFSPALLNEFCDKGVDALTSCTPASILSKTLSNPRYDSFGTFIEEHIC